MLRMTPAQTRASGLGNPSLPQLWLTAMLRMLVELVRNVASTLQMTRRRLAAECHSDVTPTDLPRETSDTFQETHPAAQHRSLIALILRDREAIISKDEGVLTTVSHTHNQSGPLVRVPRERGDPDSLKQEVRDPSAKARRAQAEAPGIPARNSGFPASGETRQPGLTT